MLIAKDQLCALIPHAGSMCLLDDVLQWDDEQIICQARSHQLPDNPLRCEQGLSAIQGIEYGAQAMAVHGGLLAQRDGAPISPGVLVAAREITVNIEWLDHVAEPLIITAHKIIRDHRHCRYEFVLSAEDQALVGGSVTVMMETPLT